MKRFSPLLSCAAAPVAVLGFLAGCSHSANIAETKARIAEKGDAFTRLTPRQQDDILGGAVERGYTTDMVYMALGKPKRIVTSADGVKSMWFYTETVEHRAPVTSTMNPPGSSHYYTGFTAANTPVNGPAPGWMMPSGSAVGRMGTEIFIQPQLSLDMPVLKSRAIYVFFFAGKVSEIKVDGDTSDQRGAAPNVAPGKKSSWSRSGWNQDS